MNVTVDWVFLWTKMFFSVCFTYTYVFRSLYGVFVLFAFWWPLAPTPIHFHCRDKNQNIDTNRDILKKNTFYLVLKKLNNEKIVRECSFLVHFGWNPLDWLNYVKITSLNLEKVTHALPSFGICTLLASQLFWHPNTGREMHLVLERKTCSLN